MRAKSIRDFIVALGATALVLNMVSLTGATGKPINNYHSEFDAIMAPRPPVVDRKLAEMLRSAELLQEKLEEVRKANKRLALEILKLTEKHARNRPNS